MYDQILMDTAAESAARAAAHNYGKPYSVYEHCSGKYVNRKDKKFVVDIDEEQMIFFDSIYEDLKDKVVTHQVMSIEKDDAGKYYFHTKGICENCLVEDPVVEESQVYGVVKYKVKTLSFIYKVVGTKVGLFFFIILPLFYIIGSEIIYTLLEKEEERRKKN